MIKGKFKNILGKRIKVDGVQKTHDGTAYTAVADDGTETFLLSEHTSELVIAAVIYDPSSGGTRYVAADDGMVMIEPYIRRKTVNDPKLEFHCLYEKTCGSIVYKLKNHRKFYLIVENDSGHIGFPKGHMCYGEAEEDTAVREVFEETGVHIKVSKKTRQEYSYVTSNGIHKNCVYFCSKFEEDEIFLQEGEIKRCWLVPFETAVNLLNYPQDAELLKKADKMHD